MGAGYMPRVVALGLLGFGLFFCVRGVRRAGGRRSMPVQLRPLLAVLGAVGVFALTAERLGLAVASVVTVILAASPPARGVFARRCPSRCCSRQRPSFSSSRCWRCRCRLAALKAQVSTDGTLRQPAARAPDGARAGTISACA
jgi:hypothetical protein